MTVSSDHSWAISVTANMDYTKVTIAKRIGKPMNEFQPRSEKSRNPWETVQQQYCYLRTPDDRSSRQVNQGRIEIGFTNENDARDWFKFMWMGPQAFALQ